MGNDEGKFHPGRTYLKLVVCLEQSGPQVLEHETPTKPFDGCFTSGTFWILEKQRLA